MGVCVSLCKDLWLYSFLCNLEVWVSMCACMNVGVYMCMGVCVCACDMIDSDNCV